MYYVGFVLSLITVMCTANSVSVSLIFFVCSWVYCAEVFDITTRGRGNGVTTLWVRSLIFWLYSTCFLSFPPFFVVFILLRFLLILSLFLRSVVSSLLFCSTNYFLTKMVAIGFIYSQNNFEGSVFWPPMSSLGIYAGVCFAAMPFVYLWYVVAAVHIVLCLLRHDACMPLNSLYKVTISVSNTNFS